MHNSLPQQQPEALGASTSSPCSTPTAGTAVITDAAAVAAVAAVAVQEPGAGQQARGKKRGLADDSLISSDEEQAGPVTKKQTVADFRQSDAGSAPTGGSAASGEGSPADRSMINNLGGVSKDVMEIVGRHAAGAGHSGLSGEQLQAVAGAWLGSLAGLVEQAACKLTGGWD